MSRAAFVTHRDPFTPFDTAPAKPNVNAAYVARIPHDEILPQVVGDAFRHRVGVKPLEVAKWFVRDADWEPTLAMKRALIADRRDEVVSFRDDCHDVAQEAAELVLTWAGKSTSRTGVDALVDAALAVPDDLTVLRSVAAGDAEQLPFVAGVVCSPSRWRLADKIGHEPVVGTLVYVAR